MGAFAPLFPLLAFVGYIFILIINYGAVGGKWFGDLDIGEVSDKYNVSLSPAGWTFGIWGKFRITIVLNSNCIGFREMISCIH